MITMDSQQAFGLEAQRRPAFVAAHHPSRLQKEGLLGNANFQSAVQWTPDFLLTMQPAQAYRWPDFLDRLRKIYGNKVTSDSQAIINELRGER
jgi:hypothetical protein